MFIDNRIYTFGSQKVSYRKESYHLILIRNLFRNGFEVNYPQHKVQDHFLEK